MKNPECFHCGILKSTVDSLAPFGPECISISRKHEFIPYIEGGIVNSLSTNPDSIVNQADKLSNPHADEIAEVKGDEFKEANYVMKVDITTEKKKCLWCGKTIDEHSDENANGMTIKTPCLGLKKYFSVPLSSPPANATRHTLQEEVVLRYAKKYYPNDTEDWVERHRAIAMAAEILRDLIVK